MPKQAAAVTGASVELLEKWTQEQGLPDWDVLLVGDGSGSTWKIGCAWGVVVVDKATRGRKVLWGGMNHGTVPIAEIMPYIHALLWYKAFRERHTVNDITQPVRVLIISDNKPLVIQGTQLATRRKTLSEMHGSANLWPALMSFERDGFKLTFHWIERVTIALNRYVDQMAHNARMAIQDAPRPKDLSTAATINVYNINVDEHRPLMPQKLRRRQRASQRKKKKETP